MPGPETASLTIPPALSLGIAVVGLGWMGNLHSRCYKRFTDHYPDLATSFRLRTAVSRSEDLRKSAVTQLGFTQAGTDVDSVTCDPEIDIVSICTPTAEHASIAVAAAEAGKSLWIEKPVGINLTEVRRVYDAVTANGVSIAVGHNYRVSPAIQEIRRRLLAGALGSIEHIRGRYDAGYAADPMTPLTWRFDAGKAGGGASSDILSHLIDLAQHLNGPIEEVVGRTKITHQSRPLALKATGHFDDAAQGRNTAVTNDDIAMLLAIFANGAFGSFAASRIARSGENALEIEVHGSHGFVSWNSEAPNEFQWRDKSMRAVMREYVDARMQDYGRFLPGPGLGIGFDDVKLIELAELVRQIRGLDSVSATASDALRVALVEHAITESMGTNSWAPVNNSTPTERS